MFDSLSLAAGEAADSALSTLPDTEEMSPAAIALAVIGGIAGAALLVGGALSNFGSLIGLLPL